MIKIKETYRIENNIRNRSSSLRLTPFCSCTTVIFRLLNIKISLICFFFLMRESNMGIEKMQSI